jgi:hypothetical protein
MNKRFWLRNGGMLMMGIGFGVVLPMWASLLVMLGLMMFVDGDKW